MASWAEHEMGNLSFRNYFVRVSFLPSFNFSQHDEDTSRTHIVVKLTCMLDGIRFHICSGQVLMTTNQQT